MKTIKRREKKGETQRDNRKKWGGGEEREMKEKKRKKKLIALRRAPSCSSSPSPSLFLSLSPLYYPPTQPLSVKTMTKPSRRFPIISISLKYLRVWRKRDGVSGWIATCFVLYIENASLTMSRFFLLSLFCFAPPTQVYPLTHVYLYLGKHSSNPPSRFSFSIPAFARPLVERRLEKVFKL